MSEISNERNPQPQDELTEDQLAEVSAGGGDPHLPIANPAPPVEEKKKKPVEPQPYLQLELENTMISN
jgi:hypothetical protein